MRNIFIPVLFCLFYEVSGSLYAFIPDYTYNSAFKIQQHLTMNSIDKSDKASKAYSKAYNLILAEKWDQAYDSLSKFLSDFPSSSYEDDVLFWRCYVMDKKGEPADNVYKSYELFVKSYPESKWCDDAKRNMINIGMRLAQSGHKEYLEKIKLMEQSRNEELKLTALFALQRMGDKVAVASVIKLYDSSVNRQIRQKCLYLLSAINEQSALDKLFDTALNESDIILRKNAITILATVNSEKTIPVLKQVLKHETDSSVKKRALISLSRKNLQYSEIKKLISKLVFKNSDTDLAKTAIYALCRNNEPKTAKILFNIIKNSPDPEIQKTALQVISRFNCPGAYNSLFENIAINSKNTSTAISAVMALYKNKTNSIDKNLINIVKSSHNAEVKSEAVKLLSKSNNRIIASFLRETALNEKDQDVACTAVLGLKNMHHFFNDNVFLEILRKTEFPQVKKCCFIALARIGDKKAFRAIAAYLKTEKDPQIRRNAILNLISFRHEPELVPFLFSIAKTDTDFKMRKVAINALGSINSPEAKSALRELSK